MGLAIGFEWQDPGLGERKVGCQEWGSKIWLGKVGWGGGLGRGWGSCEIGFKSLLAQNSVSMSGRNYTFIFSVILLKCKLIGWD